MTIDGSNNLATVRDTPGWPTPGLCAAFSAMGSSVMLMLEPGNGYKAELVHGDGGGGDCVASQPTPYLHGGMPFRVA